MGFGSIPYPAVSLSDAGLEDVIVAAAAAHGLASLRYFPGISDMSFLGEASGDLSACAANTPIWGTSFTMPERRPATPASTSVRGGATITTGSSGCMPPMPSRRCPACCSA